MVSMYLVINLLLQCACDLTGIPLPLKGERVSSSVFTTHSVFAFPFITANQFSHSNVPCIIFGFIMLDMLNANLGLITCWSKITFTLKDFYTVHCPPIPHGTRLYFAGARLAELWALHFYTSFAHAGYDSNARYHQRLPPAHRVKGQTREGGGI